MKTLFFSLALAMISMAEAQTWIHCEMKDRPFNISIKAADPSGIPVPSEYEFPGTTTLPVNIEIYGPRLDAKSQGLLTISSAYLRSGPATYYSVKLGQDETIQLEHRFAFSGSYKRRTRTEQLTCKYIP